MTWEESCFASLSETPFRIVKLWVEGGIGVDNKTLQC